MTPQQRAEAYLGALGDANLAAGQHLVPLRLAAGRRHQVSFDVADVLELAADERIAALHIVYDTAGIRPSFERETGTPSWREDDPAALSG
jgi:hypothetical protein